MNTVPGHQSYLVKFGEDATKEEIKEISRTVSAEGSITIAVDQAIIIRVPHVLAEEIANHRSVDHVGSVTINRPDPPTVKR